MKQRNYNDRLRIAHRTACHDSRQANPTLCQPASRTRTENISYRRQTLLPREVDRACAQLETDLVWCSALGDSHALPVPNSKRRTPALAADVIADVVCVTRTGVVSTDAPCGADTRWWRNLRPKCLWSSVCVLSGWERCVRRSDIPLLRKKKGVPAWFSWDVGSTLGTVMWPIPSSRHAGTNVESSPPCSRIAL